MSAMTRLAAAAAILAIGAPAAHAVTEYDQNVTSNVIFGSGNANGGFTTDRANNIELGLRAKVRFPTPQNVFNSNGDGSYTFQAGARNAANPTTPLWSFEWSVNADLDGLSNRKLDDLDYAMYVDGDPGAGTDYATVFDPINGPYADHGIGDNTTANGGGAKATSVAEYASLIAANSLAQNSWRYDFFNDVTDPLFLSQLSGFNPNVNGVYTITLTAFVKGTSTALASTSIDVNVVPLPAGALLLLSGFGLAGALRLRAVRRG